MAGRSAKQVTQSLRLPWFAGRSFPAAASPARTPRPRCAWVARRAQRQLMQAVNNPRRNPAAAAYSGPEGLVLARPRPALRQRPGRPGQRSDLAQLLQARWALPACGLGWPTGSAARLRGRRAGRLRFIATLAVCATLLEAALLDETRAGYEVQPRRGRQRAAGARRAWAWARGLCQPSASR